MQTTQDRARNYIAPIRSISGSGGHTSALAAATAFVMEVVAVLLMEKLANKEAAP